MSGPTDLRGEPLEVRKATLASILRRSRLGIRLDEGARLRPDVFPARLQDGAGRDRLEAPWIALPIGPISGLTQV